MEVARVMIKMVLRDSTFVVWRPWTASTTTNATNDILISSNFFLLLLLAPSSQSWLRDFFLQKKLVKSLKTHKIIIFSSGWRCTLKYIVIFLAQHSKHSVRSPAANQLRIVANSALLDLLTFWNVTISRIFLLSLVEFPSPRSSPPVLENNPSSWLQDYRWQAFGSGRP